MAGQASAWGGGWIWGPRALCRREALLTPPRDGALCVCVDAPLFLLVLLAWGGDAPLPRGVDVNHTLFFSTMTPAAKAAPPLVVLSEAIDGGFGSFDKMRAAFTSAATGLFGSGCVWGAGGGGGWGGAAAAGHVLHAVASGLNGSAEAFGGLCERAAAFAAMGRMWGEASRAGPTHAVTLVQVLLPSPFWLYLYLFSAASVTCVQVGLAGG